MANKKSPKKKNTSTKKKNTSTKKKTTNKTNTASQSKNTKTTSKKNATSQSKNTKTVNKKNTTSQSKNTKTAAKKNSPVVKKVVKENVKETKAAAQKAKTVKNKAEETKKTSKAVTREVKHEKPIVKTSAKDLKKNRERLFSANEGNSDYDTIKRLIIITVTIVLVLTVVHLITSYVRKDKSEDELIVEEYQNEKILSSKIFNKADNEYYVVIYDLRNEDKLFIRYLASDYRSLEILPIFEVDITNPFNKEIVADEDEETLYTVDKLKVKGEVLLKIKDGKIESTKVGEKEITDFLRSLITTDEE